MSQANSLKKGDIILSSTKRPCKIVSISISKTGKHGSAKAHLELVDIFTNKKSTEICKSQDTIIVPEINRYIYILTDIDEDGYLITMDKNANIREDLKIDDERFEDLKKRFEENNEKNKDTEVTILSCMDEEKIIDFK